MKTTRKLEDWRSKEPSSEPIVQLKEPTSLVFAETGKSLRKPYCPEESTELGSGGVLINKRGYAEPCNGTETRVDISLSFLTRELTFVSTDVKRGRGALSGTELKSHFGDSPLFVAADQSDWDGWSRDFSPENPDRGTPRGAALTFLERIMTLKRGTLKSYASRVKKQKKSNASR